MNDVFEFTFGFIKRQDLVDVLTNHCGEYVRVLPIMDHLGSDLSIEYMSDSEMEAYAKANDEYQKRQVELGVQAAEIAQGAVAKFRKMLAK